MSAPVPANIVVEDELSEAVLRRLLASCGGPWAVLTVYSRGGSGYITKNISGFDNASKGTPFVILLDLDDYDCAARRVRALLPRGPRANTIFRIAVREVEAWLLADTKSMARFLGIRPERIPNRVEQLADPKATLVRLAAKAGTRAVREDIVPPKGSTAKQGRAYNARLSKFVSTQWDPKAARANSDSLDRAMHALERFAPSWAGSQGD